MKRVVALFSVFGILATLAFSQDSPLVINPQLVRTVPIGNEPGTLGRIGGPAYLYPGPLVAHGDRLYIPTQPSTVSVMGAVYNESAFFLTSGKQLSWYLERAGGSTREADESRTFVLRADGSIVSKTMSNASWKSKFKDVLPGDSIVVPLRLDRPNFMRNLKDWSQVISQFALGAAAIRVLGQ